MKRIPLKKATTPSLEVSVKMDQMSYCLTIIACQLWLFPTTMNPLIFIAVCMVRCFIFLPTWTSCRMHTPYSSLHSYCCENKYAFLFSPLLTVNLVEQQLFRALRKLPDSAQIKHRKIISRLQRCGGSLSSKVLYSVVLIWKMLTKSDKLIASRLPLVNWEFCVFHMRSGANNMDRFHSPLRIKVAHVGRMGLTSMWGYIACLPLEENKVQCALNFAATALRLNSWDGTISLAFSGSFLSIWNSFPGAVWRLLSEAEKVNARPPAQVLRKHFHLYHLQSSSDGRDRQTVAIPVPWYSAVYFSLGETHRSCSKWADGLPYSASEPKFLLPMAPPCSANQQQRQENEEGTWTVSHSSLATVAWHNGAQSSKEGRKDHVLTYYYYYIIRGRKN